MAQLRRGRYVLKLVTVHQWANDWFTIEEDTTKVIKPTNIALNKEEAKNWRMSPNGMDELFTLNPDGTFTRKRGGRTRL